MKKLTIVMFLFFSFCSLAHGALTLSFNGEDVDSVVLKEGQSCSVEVLSDDSSIYSAYLLYDTNNPVDPFLDINSIESAAGTLASEIGSVIKSMNLTGSFVTSDGGPTPGVHFTFIYIPSNPGEMELKLYDDSLTSVLASISVTVLTSDVGSAFTYQGRLVDNALAANGKYDFIFKLYNSPSYGSLLGDVVEINDIDAVDGHFIVDLDFGSSAFAGDGDWLETSVRVGTSNGSFTMLSPRQRITPTPYAIYAGRSDWNNLVNMPADIADGDDDTDTILTESQIETYIVNDVTTGYLPYDNGTKLVDSGLKSDGSNIGLGASALSSRKLYVYSDSNIEAVYGINANTDITGSRYALHGISIGNTSFPSFGVRGSSESSAGHNYGVYGVTTTASSGNNYGVYGTASNGGEGDAYAGYFNGNVYVTSDVSAESFTDRTPYPKDLATAYEAVMSMERLGDGLYMEDDKEQQLDHSALSSFIRSEGGYRDLSATVSCQNEVIKDLVRKQKGLIKSNEQIDLLKEQLDAMRKENQELKKYLSSIESMLSNQVIEQKGDL